MKKATDSKKTIRTPNWGPKAVFLVILLLGAGGCATLPKPENHATKSEWMKAVEDYRKQFSENPADYEIKMKLEMAELNAAEAFYDDGMSFENDGQLDDAIYQFRQGLSAMPNNEKISNALKNALSQKESNTFYQQAVDLDKAGKEDDAKNLLSQALAAEPDNAGAKALLDKINAGASETTGGLEFSFEQPISHSFQPYGFESRFGFYWEEISGSTLYMMRD